MNNSDYFQHHSQLINDLYHFCLQQLPFCDQRANDVDLGLIDLLKSISEAKTSSESFQQRGQEVIGRIVGQYSHITPAINRDLFWFFGGECLHYMGEDELSLYQQLDELLHNSDGEQLSYQQAKANIFQLH